MASTSLSILLVEDDKDIRELLTEELEDAGFDVETAVSGQAALQRLQRVEALPDVVLSNFGLPGMDGREFLHEIRGDAKLPDIPVVLMTGGIFADGDLSDADAVILKPLDVDDVIDVLQRVHRRRQIREAPRTTDYAETASHP